MKNPRAFGSGAIVWAIVFAGVLLWSGIGPKDRFTWFLEVLPALIAAALLACTRTRFPFTTLAYVLMLVHCVVLMVGGHFTYAEVPWFDWIRDTFGHARNNYDKVGHFAQGFVPAIIAREILIRNEVVRGRIWLGVLVTGFCLGLSAFYELIEWWVAVGTGEAGDAFLGTQGYIWDTQSDMAWALVGAIVALVTLSAWHNQQIARLMTR